MTSKESGNSELCPKPPSRPVFLRDATGLVRSLGFLDQFVISQGITAIIIGFIFTALYAPYFFPGADLRIVVILGTIPALAMAYIYGVFSAGMPRSGGDYVWSSRILGPLYGAVQMVFLFVTAIVIMGLPGTAFVSMGLSQVFFSLGATESNQYLLGIANTLLQPVPGWAITMLLAVVGTMIGLAGLRFFRYYYRVATILFLIGNVGFIVLLATVNQSTFPGIFNSAMQAAGSNATYNNVIQQAQAGGALASGFSLQNTLLASIPWGFLTYTGWNFGTYLAGETKNVQKSMTKALVLSTIMTAVFLVVMSIMVYSAFGSNFLNAASYIASSNPSALPTLPTTTMLLSLTNPTIALFLAVTVVPGFALTCFGYLATLPGMLFAASFDRLLPSKFADVGERLHTPYIAVIFTGVVWALWMTVLAFGGFASSWLNTSIVAPIGFLLPLLAAALFPVVKPELFKRTVGAVASSAVVIITSLIGVVAFIVYIIAETFPISSGTFLGTSLTLAYEVVIVLAAIGTAIYLVAKVRMARQGISISHLYAELPPE